MIYTSYFAKLKSIEKLSKETGKVFIPISICGKAPDWYSGLQYKKLAPKYGFFMEWKKNKDNNYYIKHFEEEVTNKLIAEEVIVDLENKVDDKYFNVMVEQDEYIETSDKYNIVLICYENPQDFCHRRLVAKWLEEKLNIEVKELEV